MIGRSKINWISFGGTAAIGTWMPSSLLVDLSLSLGKWRRLDLRRCHTRMHHQSAVNERRLVLGELAHQGLEDKGGGSGLVIVQNCKCSVLVYHLFMRYVLPWLDREVVIRQHFGRIWKHSPSLLHTSGRFRGIGLGMRAHCGVWVPLWTVEDARKPVKRMVDTILSCRGRIWHLAGICRSVFGAWCLVLGV
jgi:hypothetical protein